MTDMELAVFFAQMPEARALFDAVAEPICARFDTVKVKVHKTQITFSNRYGFAYVSLPIRRVKGWPKVGIIVTFGLDHQVQSPRIFQAVEPYPRRWTHHVLVAKAEEVDAELMGWIEASYAFSMLK